ncbi:SDR family oxidoreductase [Pantoea sp. A4]|uniref:SDR family oxidoreductase n=1 Tax=Pantoea sp. A4 TaxID=1225184 RepID=UPI00036FC698|nr:SDR family oxidoreductase [Pantoea sp. A4]
MRIFLTGSTGFVGSQVAQELINGGHQVLGVTRSEAGAEKLATLGIEAYRGDLNQPESLQRGAAECDGVIHTAFDHDFSNFVANCEKDRRVILALGDALAGSQRPLIITSGVAIGADAGGLRAHEDNFNPDYPHPRIASELAGNALLERGLNVMTLRLAQIHNPQKQGLVTEVIRVARSSGISAWVGNGDNPWSAAGLSDTARLYRLALEKGQPGARYNAVAEEAISFKDIALAIGERLGLPGVSLTTEQATAHFGWMANFVTADMSADNARTRQRLQWQPTGPGLLQDLAQLEVD